MNAYTGALAALLITIQVVALFALIKKRNDYADVFWGPGFVVAACGALIVLWISKENFSLGVREITILTCVSFWALRLFFHVGLRTIRKSQEDIRYLNWRKEWGATWIWRSYLQVFVLQGLILFVIATPILYAFEKSPREISGLDAFYLGLIIWLIGFLFESIGDAQLEKFKANPANKGQIMTQGLWSWSRHPNYFGEVAQWWGIFLMAVDSSGLWLIISPITITFFIMKVSGVPMLEKLMESRPGFQEYKNQTSAFFPWFPKKKNI